MKISDKAIALILSCSNKELAELTVENLSNMLGVSVYYLSRKFKLEQDIPLKIMLALSKINRSVRVLAQNPTRPVKEVAEHFGYSSTDHFCKVFRDRFGFTPDQYRRICVALRKKN